MNAASSSVLGFDFGTKRIGVAVGQTITRTANPVATVRASDGRPDWSAINALIDAWTPGSIVVGMPVNMDGSEHTLAPAALRFAGQLAGRFGLPVYTVDERLSSYEARSREPERKRGPVDAIAAQVILETWFADPAPHSERDPRVENGDCSF
ncbi:MAG: Holliday junction resolvase RuvX [Pseudomonadota bacterium]|nr:Holliday junction resolvase RuvX [Pseudomonadota bacterium]